MPKLLAFAGSCRKRSFNKRLVRVAAAGAEQAGAAVTLIDLADFPMPIFDEDLEAAEGMPANARTFKRLLIDHDGFLIASPEYNSSISAVLKNSIDWASRKESEDESPLLAFRDKVACIMAASPGGLGGLRGLVVLRMLLENLGTIVLPEQRAVPAADKAFTATGKLKDSGLQGNITRLGTSLTRVLEKLGA